MPREEAALALNDVSFAYSEGTPRDEKSFREIVATRAKLLSSTIPLNEVADFSVVKEIRLK